jgi:RND superfamily putative drug exporter
MFSGLGRIVVAHPWRVITVWVLAAIAIIGFSSKLTSTSQESDFLPKHYESIKAIDLQDKAFPAAFTPSAIMVFQRSDGGKLTAADSAKVTQVAGQLQAKHIKYVEKVLPGQASPNKLVQTVGVQMPNLTGSSKDDKVIDSVKTLRDDVKPMLNGSDLKVGTTGSVAQSYDQQKSGNSADAIVFIATIGLILILLLVIFRSPIIALLPVILIAIVSQIANGLIADISNALNLKTDPSISQLLIVVLFGIGTDYILFLMFRYRERLRMGEDPKRAMEQAVTRVGEAITSAAGVVIIAFLAMTLSSLAFLRSMGPALAIAVAVTLLAGITLVPAVVSLLGTKVFWPSKAWKKEPTAARFTAIGKAMGRRPAVFAAVAGLVMAALALGALNFNPTFDLAAGSTSKTAESQVALTDLEKGLPSGATDPTHVDLHTNSGQLSAGALTTYGQQLQQVSGVGGVAPPTLSKDKATADYTVTLKNDPASDKALATVKGPLRDVAHQKAPAGSTALVGGTTSVYVDIHAAMNRDYLVVFITAALLIMLILGLQLRSLVAPWYLMASVGLGFAATLGATTLLFQNIRGESGLIFMLPVIMYMFVVALGTDYNILMVSRLREEAREGRSPREAAAIAVKHAGPTIAAAGLILAGSFSSLSLAGNSLLAEMGFALGFGIAVSAFVMAMFFTPALTALIGHRAWWPGHADQQREEAEPVADPPAREPVSDLQ